MFEEHRAFDSNAIVIDPAVPRACRRAIESKSPVRSAVSLEIDYFLPPGRLSASDAYSNVLPYGRLIPFGRPAPVLRPPRVMSRSARRARNSAICTVIVLAGALMAAASGSLPFVIVFLFVTAVTTITFARAAFDASQAGWTAVVTEPEGTGKADDAENWYVRHAPAYYHRRYVVPRTDIDNQDVPVWVRAIAAANGIRESELVRQRLIDSARVALAVPELLWEIAEGLARLCEVRQRQGESLSGADPRDPRIAVKVRRQGRELTIAARHIEQRVRRLEEFAGLLNRADTLMRTEAALGRLDEVDDMLLELRARAEDKPSEADPTGFLRLEVQAVIEQANEAARNLALPDENEDDDDAPEDMNTCDDENEDDETEDEQGA
jgi:hypothetical protein